MSEHPPAAELLHWLQAGNPEAAAVLYNRYARQLCHLAEQHLSRKLAGRLDGEDIVQSVFRTFFRRSAEGEFAIESSTQLWGLLVQITRRKAQAAGRYHSAGVRDVAAERPAGDAGVPDPVAREADPAEAAALVDEIEKLVRGLPARYCQLVEARLRGLGVPEISAQLGVSRRTIQRALSMLEQRLTRSAAAEGR